MLKIYSIRANYISEYYTAINKTQSRIDKCVQSKQANEWRQEKKITEKKIWENLTTKRKQKKKKMNADGLRELCANIHILKSLVESEHRDFFQKIMMLCPVQICHKFSKRFQ